MSGNEDMELRDEKVRPDDDLLKGVLGRSFAAYRRVLELYGRHGLTHEWRYYRDGKAWLCKVGRRSKTVVWMSAHRKYFKATIYVPERSVKGLLGLEVGDDARKRLRESKRVGASRACTFELRAVEALRDFEAVMVYKLGLA